MPRRSHATRLLRPLAVTLLAPGVFACSGGDTQGGGAAGTAPGDLRVEGFATPESAVHDTVADVYLVSNVNGNPLDRDGNGFISRVSPDGRILEREWISGGAAGVTLNAPKGLAIEGGTLYVADIDCIRLFDRATGAHKKDVCLEHATFLNDIASSDDGTIFFTDSGLTSGPDGLTPSGTDAVYRMIDDDRVVAVKKDAALGEPNGLTVGRRGIVVVTFGSGEVYRLDVDGNRTEMMPASKRALDGIVALPDGGFAMSSWGDSAVYRVGADGKVAKVVQHLDGPADIGFDAKRGRLLIPVFNTNVLLIHPLG